MTNYKHLIVRDEVHEMVVKKYGEFLANGINTTMIDLASEAVKLGLDKVKVK